MLNLTTLQAISLYGEKTIRDRGVRFDSKVGQIGPKWDKSGTYSDQISVHFGSESQNALKSDLIEI